MIKYKIDEIIKQALVEDMNYGDITSETLLSGREESIADLIVKDAGVISGIDIFEYTFKSVDETCAIEWHVSNGDEVVKGQRVGTIRGASIHILRAERTALNLIQRMSGIATLTHQYVDAVKPYDVRIVDTRKTVPGLRVLDKMAVRCGGGYNHRFNLSDAVMIKDNHIRAVGSIQEAVKRAKAGIPHTTKIEVEVESLAELEEALDAGADIIMLDNMSLENMSAAVKITAKRAVLEASGNVTLDCVRAIAETGVDVISVGALTHSVKALDLSLRFRK
ncbi:carboxylating nicotinate-nucleotide diphosphorylase [Fusibacter ferrireducens]|uniref:nicotinate-nucleotide diphosphorylase (carboxylating) n=1 Tax=Fusibacter ferrireducens TaxID=2785058 RepID=A0ABR9ZVN1_9FIRM|nr:carboxylating nicotinate-nucleotide diphosphorylase [Fusibacter ferrireducens]MBF4694528.1 carboxylating nicotinate-nucleotide diphosphorylase [Fusibacter ferrireducens]